MPKTSSIFALLIAPLVVACGDDALPSGPEPLSATYYLHHPREATSIAKNCIALRQEKERTLSLWEYQHWRMSNQWINCENAILSTDSVSMSKLY